MELDDAIEVFPAEKVENDGVASSCLSTPVNNRLVIEDPLVGMCFQTASDGVEYYKEYGRYKGFDTRIRSTDKKQRGTKFITSCRVVCEHEGKHEKSESTCEPSKTRNSSSRKCDCKAGMRFTWRPAGYYEVTTVELTHNHGLVSPSKMMKVNKKIPETARTVTKRYHDEGLHVDKVAAVVGGSLTGFSKNDCQSHFGATKKNPKKGDATAVLHYFKLKQEKDPHFFYAIQADDEGRAINYFWVNGKNRIQYDHFGDVVVFDTTYKTNAYMMPFAPFTGVNHHLQSIQFGCALLLDETEDTFVWLFKTWLAAMGGRPPVSMLTDQDRAMTAAVARVFPDTRHRFCLWHITKKFPEKFRQVIKKNESFHDELKLIISGSYRVKDFEDAWKAHFLKYNLHEDSWVIELFDMRSKWVPVFHLNTFYAGMNTTGRGESMNSIYDGFVDHNSNLIDFVVGSDRLNDEIFYDENEYDYRAEHRTRVVTDIGAYLLKHAAKIYTKRIFLELQKQWTAALTTYIIGKEEVEDGGYTAYTLRSRSPNNLNSWIVNFNVTIQEGNCECKYFEFMGLPCGHLLKVFLRHDIDLIPSHFILRRWSQGANTYRSLCNYDATRATGRDDFGALRAKNLSRVSAEFAAACSHPDDYKYAMEMFKVMFLEVERRKEARKNQSEDAAPDLVMDDAPLVDPTEILLPNPNISQTKGRPKQAERYKKGIESTKRNKTG
ncbi:hypothetical protein ACHQM5_012705 [Ranunculus cassubicifolius]